LALRYALPLAAAFLAALLAHVSIDIVGDYVLPHDTYDDPEHGSRWVASIALGICALGALGALGRAVFAETRGRRGAVRAALRMAAPSSALAFGIAVTAIALPLLAAMAWLDDTAAGIGPDDVADLFGGSIPLGASITAGFALAIAAGLHRFVVFLTGKHRSIVRALEAFVRIFRARTGAALRSVSRLQQNRPRVSAALARCTSGNRAPPARLIQPLQA
jgi:hypothetical protein